MSQYEMVVGLEVHAELCTNSKIYCSCRNAFGMEVNTTCCPICMGLPGTLPTLNEKVVEYAIKMGHALHCDINRICKQDRKNYFYPDLPKAYQISQYDIPLCENGYLDILLQNGQVKRIGITRLHIEEDAGKVLHDDSFAGTLVDFNRCGVPLIEIVSEPDMRSSAEAKAYLETIRSYLLYLGISDAKMQEGSIRCDVNVSARKVGEEMGTRCEMKNVNTFSGAVKAIEFEFQRQVQILENGGTIEQQTRRWDSEKGETVLLRSKENAQDYRYFPEPDLKTIAIDEQKVEAIKSTIPEMPNDKIIRYMKEYQLSQTDASLIADNLIWSKLFEETVHFQTVKPKLIANWILTDVAQYMNESGHSIFDTSLDAKRFCDMLTAIENGVISNTAAKKVFAKLLDSDETVSNIIEQQGLGQNSNQDELIQIVVQVLEENQKSVQDYANGKTNAFGFLMGQCMKKTKGKGNPNILKEELMKRLKNA
mgnify:CR=1 FL=1